jgi:hypothetical protein
MPEGVEDMRLPPEVIDRILDQVRPGIPPGYILSRPGPRAVGVQNLDHEVFGFAGLPLPSLGTKRHQIKSLLTDFVDSLCEAMSDATKTDWPGPGRKIVVTTSADKALIEIRFEGGRLAIDVPSALWG